MVYFYILVLILSIQKSFSSVQSYQIKSYENRPNTYIFKPKEDIKKLPLVILLHGHGANGVLQNFYMGIRKHISYRKFILAIPSGTKDQAGHHFWNDGILDLSFLRNHSDYNSNIKSDDFKFLDNLIEQLISKHDLDTSKIFLIGHSNGGFFSYSYACNGKFPIKKVVVLAGGISEKLNCHKRFDITHIHGLNDNLVKYEGLEGYFYSVKDNMHYWESHLNCYDSNKEDSIDLTYTYGHETEKISWNGCVDNKKLELWNIKRGSHIPLLKPKFSKIILENIFQ